MRTKKPESWVGTLRIRVIAHSERDSSNGFDIVTPCEGLGTKYSLHSPSLYVYDDEVWFGHSEILRKDRIDGVLSRVAIEEWPKN